MRPWCFVFASLIFSQANCLEIQQPLLEFEVRSNPDFLKLKGKGDKLSYTFNVTDKNVWEETFVFELDSLTTGLNLKDKLIKKKCLEVEKFPQATLSLSTPKASILELKSPQKVKAKLTLKGVTRDVWVVAQREGAHVKAKLDFKASSFGIEVPTWNGLKLADKVATNVSFNVLEPAVAPELAR